VAAAGFLVTFFFFLGAIGNTGTARSQINERRRNVA
jgi:hypothetical protein